MADVGQWWRNLELDGRSQKCLGIDDGASEDNWNPLFAEAESDSNGAEAESGSNGWREVTGACFATAQPKPLLLPRIVCSSPRALELFGAHGPWDATADQMCGNELPENAMPAAHCYCGHQLGLFAGQLGDGAVVTLGSAVAKSGQKFEMQLKGAGPTPFTRSDVGSGRKNVGDMVREFLLAEGLAALGVPTTRSLAVVTGSDPSEKNDCGVLARAASTFLRFGSFEVALPRFHDVTGRCAPSAGDVGLLKRIADYCIAEHFPALLETPDDEEEEDEDLRASPRYCALVLEVAQRSARLVATWYCLGAIHGMLNTDNMSVLGETLDHGSFAFMEATDPDFHSRSGDSARLYCFGSQRTAVLWCCQRFADALLPLHCTSPKEMSSNVTEAFDCEFDKVRDQIMSQKLGLQKADPELMHSLIAVMERCKADWTHTFRALTKAGSRAEALAEVTRYSGAAADWNDWLQRYEQCLAAAGDGWSSTTRRQKMEAVNPIVVPRSRLLERAVLAAESGDYSEVQRVLELVTNPFSLPSDAPDEVWPRGSSWLQMPPLDPAQLGPMGVRAVEALDDAEYWRRMCPDLHVASPESLQKASSHIFSFSDEHVAKVRAMMELDGVFTLQPEDLPWAVDVSAIARGLETLYEAGLPPTCILAYDEPWIMAAQLSPLLEKLIGTPISFDWLAFRAPPGRKGFPPHRDKDLGNKKPVLSKNDLDGTGFRPDGTPQYATCWVALVDVPATGSCLMCVPRRFDSGYLAPGQKSPVDDNDALCNVRPLPLQQGGMACFSHRLYHWSRSGDAVDANGAPAGNRLALSISAQDGEYEKHCLPLSVLPFPPLRLRVALAAGQWFQYSGQPLAHKCDEEMVELLWECFLSCAKCFSEAYSCKVFEMRTRCSLKPNETVRTM